MSEIIFLVDFKDIWAKTSNKIVNIHRLVTLLCITLETLVVIAISAFSQLVLGLVLV